MGTDAGLLFGFLGCHYRQVCLPTARPGARASWLVYCRSRLGFPAVCGSVPCPHAPFALKVTLKPTRATSLPRMFQPPPCGAPVPCAYVQVRTGAHTYRKALASTAAPACLATERGRRERRAHTGGDPSDVLGRQRAIPVSTHESSRTPVWARDTFLSPGLLSF